MTLIEMLVVLAIIGVVAGVTVLGFGMSSPGRSVEAEARRLASRVQLAADGMMIDETPVALVGNETSYSFLSWEAKGWQPTRSEALAAHRLPDGITLNAKDSQPLPLAPDGAGAPFALTLSGAKDRWSVAYDGLSATAQPVPGL